MFGTILQRTIFVELVTVFLLSLGSLTGMFLLGGLVQEASQRGLAPMQILAVIPLLIPSTLPYTVPATTLFAVSVVYGRMAGDNEIIALRAAGVHLGRLLAPALLLGLLAGVTTFAMLVDFVPRTHGMLATQFVRDLDSLLLGILKREGAIRHPKLPYAIHVRDVRGQRLIEPIFKQRNADGSIGMVARAREATLWTDSEQGKAFIHMPQCAVAGDGSLGGSVRDRVFDMPLDLSAYSGPSTRAMDMTWRATLDRQRDCAERIADRAGPIQALRENPTGKGISLAESQQQLAVLLQHDKDDRRMQAKMRTERHNRLCLALGCLAFVAAGLPVGIWMGKSDYLSAFVSCFLPVVFVYYPLLLCGSNLSRDGKVPPFPAVWMANIAVGGAGAWMIRKLVRQ